MGQYILVEKDARVMQKCWKWLIVLLLLTTLICCLLSSYFFSALSTNFNDNCVTVARIKFKKIPSTNETFSESIEQHIKFQYQKAKQLDDEFRSYYLSNELRHKDDTGAVPKTQIFQIFNSRSSDFWSPTERSSQPYMVPTISANDTDIFKNDQIDELKTKWGDNDTCLLYYYFPVIEITTTIVWIVLILISRREGDQSTYTIIHKAWRLVVPAAICFGVMAICCVIYAAYLNSHLNAFCDEFKQKFSNNEIPCSLLLNRYSINDTTAFSPDTNFQMAKTIAYFRIFVWLLSGFVMLLRCILGADFEMHEVEYCAEQRGLAFDPQTDEQSCVKFIDDGIRRYSRERVYNPTTEQQTLK